MKRIAAIAALTVALGGIPVTAMASTASPAQGPGPAPAPVRLSCPPRVIKPAPAPTPTSAPKPVQVKPAPGKPVFYVVCCGQPLTPRSSVRPVVVSVRTRACKAQVVVFDMAAGSSVVTEVSGARLHSGERLRYQREVYTVRSVWGRKFDVDQGGKLVVNTGPAIHDGVATTINPIVIVWAPLPPPKH
jgi:hypothetical protein